MKQYIALIILALILVMVVIWKIFQLKKRYKTEKDAIEIILIQIQKFLIAENDRLHFTQNNITISGKYDSNFITVFFAYLHHKGLFKDYTIQEAMQDLLVQSVITMKDVTELLDLLQIANNDFKKYLREMTD